MNTLSTFDGEYAAKWSISDFYDENAAQLQEAIASGNAFNTGWFGAKKEIEYGLIQRDFPGDVIRVHVRCSMDSDLELVDTAFWKAFGGGDTCTCGRDALAKLGITDDYAAEAIMLDIADVCELGEDNDAEDWTELPATASYEEVINSLDIRAANCRKQLEDWYQVVVDHAKDVITDLRKEQSAPTA